MSPGRADDQGPNLAWSALFVVVSLLGGLAAADIAHVSALAAVIFSLLVAAVMVILLYMGLLDDKRGDPHHGHRREQPPAEYSVPADRRPDSYTAKTQPYSSQPTSRPVEEPPPPRPEPGLVQLVQPRPGTESGGDWWQGHMAARPAERGAAQPARRKVDLAQFLDQALIAQCPRCGGFRLDVDNRAAEWVFRCQECGQGWPWQPGTPWPEIAVRPEARRGTDKPRG